MTIRATRLAACLLIAALPAAGGCSLHPAEGAAAGAAGGAAVGLTTSVPLAVAAPAGAVAGAGAVSLVEGYRSNRSKCPELFRCVY